MSSKVQLSGNENNVKHEGLHDEKLAHCCEIGDISQGTVASLPMI